MRILSRYLGYVPDRATSIMIMIFIGVSVALNFPNDPSSNSKTWYVLSSVPTLSSTRPSVLAIASFSLAIMLSGRSSILVYLTGCSRGIILVHHRWAGRVAVIKAIAHSAIHLSQTDKYTITTFTTPGALSNIGCDGSYWNVGIATLAILAAILLLSCAPFRVPSYDAFLVSQRHFGDRRTRGAVGVILHIASTASPVTRSGSISRLPFGFPTDCCVVSKSPFSIM